MILAKHAVGLTLVAVLGLLVTPVHAIFFDLDDGAQGLAVDGLASGPATVSGLTATITANTGVLNQASGNFGVNATGTGDVTDQFDGAIVSETITITFNSPVIFESVDISQFGANDLGTLTLNGLTIVNLASGNVPAGNIVIPAGNTAVIAWTGDNLTGSGRGFSFDGFTVSLIPEPASLAILGVGGLLLLRRARA